jgi:hypothetical protein
MRTMTHLEMFADTSSPVMPGLDLGIVNLSDDIHVKVAPSGFIEMIKSIFHSRNQCLMFFPWIAAVMESCRSK